MRRVFAWASAAAAMGLALASCSYAPRAAIRNESGADLLLWPLGARPVPLAAGASLDPVHYTPYERQQALIARGGCLYTYPAPDYSALPKGTRGYRARVVVVIGEDMRLSLRPRSKKGVEGPDIAAAGFPLKPERYCGSRG